MSWFEGDFTALRSTRELAVRYGAHFTAAAMDLNMADAALANFDAAECIAAAAACADASRRYGLSTESVANLWLAGGHAIAGDDDAMNDALQTAMAKSPDDPRLLADLYGRVYTTRAFVRDELDDLPRLVDQMIVHVRDAPATTSIYPGRILWALIHAISDDDLGVTVRDEYDRTTAPMGFALFEQFGRVLDAVRLGRLGSPDEAAATFDDAAVGVPAIPAAGMMHSSMLLVSGAAIRDGWGDPVTWLRQSEAWFAERGFKRHYDPGMEDYYFLVPRGAVLGTRLEIVRQDMPNDPRKDPAWRAPADNPLGIEGLQAVGISTPSLDEARDLFAGKLEWPELGERAVPDARCAAFAMGDTVIEALAGDEGSPIAAHARDVKGICHLVFKVRDAGLAAEVLRRRGLTLIGDVADRFAIAPEEAHGRLIWLTERTPGGYPPPGSKLGAGLA
jgi:hypothetical protein